MNDVLIIFAHPNYAASKANRTLLETISNNEHVKVHNIYEANPNGKIDVPKEQALLEKYQRIIIQFPTFWFNVPGFLKTWLDEVLLFGWAYGPGGTALKNKEIGIVTTTGGAKEAYQKQGTNGFTVEEYLLPMIKSIHYIGANYMGLVSLNNAFNLQPEEVKTAKIEYEKLVLNKK